MKWCVLCGCWVLVGIIRLLMNSIEFFCGILKFIGWFVLVVCRVLLI